VAEVIGDLRPDKATHGEKLVLNALRAGLPQEFSVYVECPLKQPARSRGRGEMRRYPDFIVLANYGVVVLEVKDWVQIVRADKFGAMIRMRGGEERRVHDPVDDARKFAILLAQELQTIPGLIGDRSKLEVPWGYAAVLPNLPASVITHLRKAWGEAFVLGMADLAGHVASKKLRATIPYNRMLTSRELNLVRGAINPSVVIETQDPDHRVVLLDQDQERIVAEPVAVFETPKEMKETVTTQDSFWLAEDQEAEAVEDLLPVERTLIRNTGIRLVRGVAGSGKSLVLSQRALYLKALYPEWKMCVLTYNDALAQSLQAQLKGSGIEAKTFHKLCSGMLSKINAWKSPKNSSHGWLKRFHAAHPMLQSRGADFLSDEIQWIKEIGLREREQYLDAARVGRGQPLGKAQREQVYELLQGYQDWLETQAGLDWADIPFLVLEKMDAGEIKTGEYDAILIDEAQDFAPIWIEVVKRILKAEGGLLFLADDPSQSVYRHYSWRAKGVPVVGRTRRLRVPYRNTRQIFEAAYEIIRGDHVLRRHLEEQQGMTLEPDLASQKLRSGPKPVVHQFPNDSQEAQYCRNEIERLLQEGVDPRQIAVLHRRRPGVRELSKVLRGLDVQVDTFHALKGLEFRVVFLCGMQECFAGGGDWNDERLSEERRLVYMAMTRAREQLYLNCAGKWPEQLNGMLGKVERVVI